MAEEPPKQRILATEKQLGLLKEVFDRTSGHPSHKQYAELGESTGLPHKYIIGWFSRKRNPKKRKQCSTDSGTDDCRSSSPMSDKAELPSPEPQPEKKIDKDRDTEPPKPQSKRFKLDAKLDRDAITPVKTETAEANIPPYSRSFLSPHTSNSILASNNLNKNVHTSPDNSVKRNHSPQIRSRPVANHNKDPPPEYTSSLDTDGFIISQPPAHVQQPVSSTIPIALTAPLALRSGFPLLETPRNNNTNTSLTLNQVQQMYRALLANTHAQTAAQYQPQAQPSFQAQAQAQLIMQPISNNQNQPRCAVSFPQLINAPVPPQENLFTAQAIQNHYPSYIASNRLVPASHYIPQTFVDAGPNNFQSPTVPLTLVQPPQHDIDPSSFSTPAQFPSTLANDVDGSQPQFYSASLDPYNSGVTPFQHLHVLEPILNANRTSQGFLFSPLNTFDVEDVQNLLLPQNTDQVMDRLLDENLVQEDPFQASMGLVWMQRVGLI
ncbi:hypothetical protein F5879DRAFT_997028 [Lentinula edodes]|uniref:Homeobox domain-containing protein n=1 Tax=Lentinula edodes TaxID=5353 RepID=A0A1Q3EGY9_LENED|nr:hypothetical protein F5879DRAFT_997028 [Lentinula edodes]GAW06488.1 hypothetical protein LENED_008417 [Lentinula edodes]